MRTIKFKGKRRDNGEWVSGDLAHSLDGNLKILGFVMDNGVIGFTGAYSIDPNTVCQFTGFLDKNGKEIYEGDVLRSDLPSFIIQNRLDSISDVRYGVVVFNSCLGSFHLQVYSNMQYKTDYYFEGVSYGLTWLNSKDFEIVGSIHDKEWKEKLNLKSE